MCIVQQHDTSESGFRFNIHDVFSRTYIVYMTISVSRRLNILCIKLKIREFFITKLITHLYARVGILLVCGKHFYGRIIPLREEAWDIKLLQLRLKQDIHESERSCICMSEVMYMYVRGIDFAFVSTILRLDFETVPIVSYVQFVFDFS